MVFRQYIFDSGLAYDSSKPTFNIRTAGFIDRFKILEVLCPVSWYTTGTNNNQISVTVGGNSYFATIPPGNYTVQNFPAALTSALTSAVPNGWSVTYNDTTKNLTVTGTSAWNFNGFLQGNTAFKQLGMEKHSATPTGTSWTGSFIDLSGISGLLLTSSQLASNDITLAGHAHINVLCKVDINVTPGSYVSWKNNASYVYCGNDINYVDFQWLDSSTLLPVSLNGKSFSISLGTVSDEDDPIMII